MTDYARAGTGGATHFTDKDGKSTGDPLKLIVGSQFDDEFNAALTAINSKHDATDIASTAQIQTPTSDAVIVSPKKLQEYADDNGGMVGDIQALADPGADTLLGWDDSASAAIGYTLSADITHAATELGILWTGAHHDGFSDFVADEHIAHSGVSITAGAGLTGGGDITETRDIAIGAGDGITVSADSIAIAATVAGAGLTHTTGVLAIGEGEGIDVAADAISIDFSDAAQIEGNALAATDSILVNVGTTPKRIAIQDAGLRIRSGANAGTTSQPCTADDMNSIMAWTGTATFTLPINSGTALPIGVPIVLQMKHATQQLTVTAAASVTLVSLFHPDGGAAASDHLIAGGTALLYKTATDVWCLSGDIST